MTTSQQDHSDPIDGSTAPSPHAPSPADPMAAVEAVGEAMLEPWQSSLALGTAWWNAAISLWSPPLPVSHHHAEAVPPPLDDDEPALFA
ncbi:hypothetical protein BH10PSE14_BH10PSE14_35630 [soil metagenome]|jgi:hypothetical protein